MNDADPTDRFVARPSRPVLALGTLACLAIVGICLWGTGLFGPPLRPDSAWVACLGMVVFGAFGALWACDLFRTGDRIVIDGTGICWSQWSDRTIPWQAIRQIRWISIGGQKFLGVYLEDPALHPPTRLRGRLSAGKWARRYGDFAMSATGTDRSFAELMAAVERFQPPDWRIERGPPAVTHPGQP